MPAKSAQKRPRESSGTPSAAVASGAQSATLTRRKRRAGSVTFEDDGSESGSTPQAKRARGGNISGNEVDVNDVVMGEQQKGRKRGGEDKANGPSKVIANELAVNLLVHLDTTGTHTVITVILYYKKETSSSTAALGMAMTTCCVARATIVSTTRNAKIPSVADAMLHCLKK